MQKEIAKRVRLYTVAAILLAIVLVSACYQFGYIPRIPIITNSAMATFTSMQELQDFVKRNSQPQGWYPYFNAKGDVIIFLSPTTRAAGPEAFFATDANFGQAITSYEHSQTNIQVTGVDEADSVKTDDHGFIYMITGNNITILKGYPPQEAKIVSVITFADLFPVGIFVNGNRLAVLGAKYNTAQAKSYDVRWNYFTEISTYAKIYDVTNRSKPELMRAYTTSGSYFNSRMIGEYVYFVASTPAYYTDTVEILPGVTMPIDKYNLPKIETNGISREVNPTEIHYSNMTDNYCLFTTIVAINIQNSAEEPSSETIMTGGASVTYVSMNNVYIGYPGANETTVYRINIHKNTIIPTAEGKVPGHVLNQFSMDEYDNSFRIATTTWAETEKNNVYVLDMNLTMIGNLTGLAPGEHIYAARFMGTKCYLVTFVKIDPLFVIDLSDSTNPRVLGELHIPGYSDYLHPYDENHLIGVGKHTEAADQGSFAWYQGVKIALFDVSNISNPIQITDYTIGDRGSDSPVLRDHKAFLFDKERQLLVVPALEAKIDPQEYPISTYPEGPPPEAYGKPVWQGAYVFNVTLEAGFQLRGRITHREDGADIWDSNYYVQRSLYIENVLYTISNIKVKMNSLRDLSLINEIKMG